MRIVWIIVLLSILATVYGRMTTEMPEPKANCIDDSDCLKATQARPMKSDCVQPLHHINSRYMGLLQTIPNGHACEDPCPKDIDVDSAKCDWTKINCPVPKKGKKTATFIEKHIRWPPVWTSDSASDKCCRTWRIPIPFYKPIRWPPGPILYPVWCRGYFQLYDWVRCVSKKCVRKKKKECKIEYTCRTFLVTHWKPHPYWGHCLYWWLPAWFITYPVPSHCYCAKLK